MPRSAKIRGFTLIELMITVAIVGILAAIAYPAYTGQIRKARRADAQSALMNIAARQQQMLLDTRSYGTSLGALSITLPESVQKTYTISLAIGTATVPGFTAKATPLGPQLPDTCGELSIDQVGAKTPTTCW